MTRSRATRVRRALLLSLVLHALVLAWWWPSWRPAEEPQEVLHFVWMQPDSTAAPDVGATRIAAVAMDPVERAQADVGADELTPSAAAAEGASGGAPARTSTAQQVASTPGESAKERVREGSAPTREVATVTPPTPPSLPKPSVSAPSPSTPDPWAASATSLGGTEQTVVDLSRRAHRSAERVRSDPLGRHSQGVYRALKRRWRRDRLQPIALPRAVVISFRIERDGRVRDTEVDVSSGDAVLDALARAAVPPRVAPLPREAHLSTVRHSVTFRYLPS